MKKIGDSTSTANGSGEWTEGNPGAGLPATLLKADWLTTIQRELINVVLGGGLTLNPNDDSQLFKAIKALQTAASTWANLAGKPTTVAGFGISDAFTKTETGAAIQAAIAALVASSPAALDTLKELATALGNDPNFATTMTNALAGKANKATTLIGYGITDAFTKTETGAAIQAAISALVASSPAALDTLKELAAALGNDPNFATTVTNALANKANKGNSLESYGILDGCTKAQHEALLALVNDPWNFHGVGTLVAHLDNNSVPAPRRDSPNYRYIRLTAGESYNAGALISESVSGTAPQILATGVVSVAGSLFDGLTIRLINTERRVLRGGLPGYVEQDAFQGFAFGDPRLADGYVLTTPTSTTATWGNGADTGIVLSRLAGSGVTPLVIKSDGTNGAPRIGVETRVKSMGATYYLRVK